MDASNPRFHSRTLREVRLLLGGERQLADFLDIETWLVSRWLEGLGRPPDDVFLRCADLIDSGKPMATVAVEQDQRQQSGSRS